CVQTDAIIPVCIGESDLRQGGSCDHTILARGICGVLLPIVVQVEVDMAADGSCRSSIAGDEGIIKVAIDGVGYHGWSRVEVGSLLVEPTEEILAIGCHGHIMGADLWYGSVHAGQVPSIEEVQPAVKCGDPGCQAEGQADHLHCRARVDVKTVAA